MNGFVKFFCARVCGEAPITLTTSKASLIPVSSWSLLAARSRCLQAFGKSDWSNHAFRVVNRAPHKAQPVNIRVAWITRVIIKSEDWLDSGPHDILFLRSDIRLNFKNIIVSLLGIKFEAKAFIPQFGLCHVVHPDPRWYNLQLQFRAKLIVPFPQLFEVLSWPTVKERKSVQKFTMFFIAVSFLKYP